MHVADGWSALFRIVEQVLDGLSFERLVPGSGGGSKQFKVKIFVDCEVLFVGTESDAVESNLVR